MSTTKDTSPPLVASVGDVFVDQSDGDKIYVCETAYDSAGVERTLTITGPGGVDITFTTVSPHAPSELVIVDGGSSGSAGLARTGSGTNADPYVYTFTLYDNSSSNDVMIALAGGQPTLTATGSDANHGSVENLQNQSFNDDILQSYWFLKNIWAKFVAVPPEVTINDASFGAYIPPIIRNILPEAVALRLAGMDGGGDLNRTAIWANRIRSAIGRARKSQQSVTNTKQTKRFF